MRRDDRLPSYGSPLPATAPPPGRAAPTSQYVVGAARRLAGVVGPEAADELAPLAAELRRLRSGLPAEFVEALGRFRRAALRAGVDPAALPAAERAAISFS